MSMDRRQALMRTLSGLAAFGLLAPALRSASAEPSAQPEPYTEAAFEAAQGAGKPILVDTYATWCPICARQAPIIEKLRAESKFKDFVVLRVDFDTQKDVMRKFHAGVQSTLIAFRGRKEVGRSTGETQPEWIEDLMDKAVSNSTT